MTSVVVLSTRLSRRQGCILEMWWRAACRWLLSKRICAKSERIRTVCAAAVAGMRYLHTAIAWI